MAGNRAGDWRVRVTQPYLPPRERYDAYLDAIYERRWLTNGGPCEAELAEKLKARFEVDHLQLVSSGTSALQLALAALEIGGDVIVTPYSFAATRNAVIRQGCRPVYADIDPATFALDPEAIARAITPETQAILVTTAYGLPCDFDGIQAVADRHGIPTVYDHAHSTGSRYRGRAIPSFGDVGALSFHATKVFHTVEGGAVICRDAALEEKLRLMKANGIDGDTIPYAGFNAKMSEPHAAMGLAILPDLDRLIAERRRRTEIFVAELLDAPVRMPACEIGPKLEWNYAYNPVIFADGSTAMRVQDALARAGFESRRYFRPAFSEAGSDHGCPVAEDLAERVLCLPMSPFVEPAQIAQMCEIVRQSA